MRHRHRPYLTFNRAAPGTLRSPTPRSRPAWREPARHRRASADGLLTPSHSGRIYTVTTRPASGHCSRARLFPPTTPVHCFAALRRILQPRRSIAARRSTPPRLRINVDTVAVSTEARSNGATSAVPHRPTQRLQEATTTLLYGMPPSPGRLERARPTTARRLALALALRDDGERLTSSPATTRYALRRRGTTRLYTVSLATARRPPSRHGKSARRWSHRPEAGGAAPVSTV